MSSIFVYVLLIWIATVCMLSSSEETSVTIVGDQFSESNTIQHLNNSSIELLSDNEIENHQSVPEVMKVTESIEQEIDEKLNLTLSDEELPVMRNNNEETSNPTELIQEEDRITNIINEDLSLIDDQSNEINDDIHESKLEFLLDELDIANKAIEDFKIQNENLTITLNSIIHENNQKHEEITLLNSQLIELKSKYNDLNNNYIELEQKYITNNNTIILLKENHSNDISNIINKLHVSERNASLLEIKAHIAKNEKNVAKLSYENCILELEATRHIQSDEMEALKQEIIEVKKMKNIHSTTSSGSSGGRSNDQVSPFPCYSFFNFSYIFCLSVLYICYY